MNLEQLKILCETAIEDHSALYKVGPRISLVMQRLPQGIGFPRGEFLSEGPRGKVYGFCAYKMRDWVNKGPSE